MKIAVIGLGHMGGWLAQMLAEKHEICVYDLESSRSVHIRNAHVLNDLPELKDFNPGLLVNAVSLQNTVDAFQSVSPYLSDTCILSDVASVKGRIPDYYKKCGFRFVSVHPMFGPTFANVERIEYENVIIIKDSDRDGAAFFLNFFKELGLNIFRYSFDEHDEMAAYSLTLPFASSIVFAACMNKTVVPGTTFKKHLETAKGVLSEDDILLSEILFNSHSLPQLEKVASRLEFLKHVIKSRDAEEAKRFFDRLRDNIL